MIYQDLSGFSPDLVINEEYDLGMKELPGATKSDGTLVT